MMTTATLALTLTSLIGLADGETWHDRAHRLDAALSTATPQATAQEHRDLIDEIMVLDADDAAGLRSKYSTLLRDHQDELLSQRLNSIAAPLIRGEDADWKRLAGELNRFSSKHRPRGQLAHRTFLYLGLAQLRAGMTHRGRASLQAATYVDPRNPANRGIEQLRRQVDAAQKLGARQAELVLLIVDDTTAALIGKPRVPDLPVAKVAAAGE